jgi:hypothetical protein
MESRVVKRIEEIYRQDAKFTERKEERSREKLPGNPRYSLCTLCDLGVLAVNLFDWERTGSPPWISS